MTEFSRRHLLAGSGALAAAVAVPAAAQTGTAKSLAGKSFLITGASSGFGNLGAPHYARLGARVFATMRNLPRPEAEELVRIAREEKLDLHVLPLDVLSEDQVNAAVAEAEKRNGGALDVLVNNAAVFIGGPIEVHDMEAVKHAFDTNLFGFQRTARAVLPAMRAKKSGLIVNVSSQQGRVIMPSMGFYSPTKFAVEAMSEQLAYELAPHGIEVVIIQPGGFPTKIGENRARETAALKARVPDRHAAGYPDLVARMGPAPAPAAASSPPLPRPLPPSARRRCLTPWKYPGQSRKSPQCLPEAGRFGDRSTPAPSRSLKSTASPSRHSARCLQTGRSLPGQRRFLTDCKRPSPTGMQTALHGTGVLPRTALCARALGHCGA
jgi:NAD(P)-dependent dehydrogenase (short-subunit alcohol dehydrogenase family)